MARKIKRTWYNKKSGEYITKEYTYDHTSRKGKTLVGKSGRVYKKNIEALIDEINSREDLSDKEKRTTINSLNSLVNQRKRDKRKLTENGFWGTEADSKAAILLANAGYSVDEVSKMYNIPEKALLNEENWNGETFSYDGRSFLLQFGYTLDIFKEIQ